MHNKKLIRFSSKIELNELVTKGNLMSSHHFTIDNRESILIYRMQGLNFFQISKLLHHPSSISRGWKRHTKENIYSPNKAQESYHIAKSHCRRKWILEIDHNLSNTVKHLFSIINGLLKKWKVGFD